MDTHSLPGFHEPFSSITHLLGALVFGVLYWRLVRSARGHRGLAAMLTVYAVSCVLLLTMSGVYHMLPDGTARSVLRRLDLAAIFILIAGTHTPVQGFFFRGAWRWGVLAVMWGIVAVGITLFSIAGENLPRGLGTSTFLLLGWIAGASGLAVWRRYGFAYVRPLVLGGVAFSIGALALALPHFWLVPGVIGPHELWHIAVLVAVSLHWTFMHRIGSVERVAGRVAEPAGVVPGDS